MGQCVAAETSRPRARSACTQMLEGNSVRGGRGCRDGGLTQVAHGVDRRAVDANFVVYVRAGGASADADIADGIAASQLLPRQDVQARKMAVIGPHSKSVIDNDQPPVARAFVGLDDHAVSGNSHGIAVLRGDIHTRMEGAFTTERVHSLAEGAR